MSVEEAAAGEIAARALQWLLRRGSWEALANEIAWEAVRATGAESSCLDWLPGLIEARLAEYVDGLEFVVEGALASARAAQVRGQPHDHAAAEAAAALVAEKTATYEVSRIYLHTLEWAAEMLTDHDVHDPRSLRSWLWMLRRGRTAVDLEVPALVADGLSQERPRAGWPDESSETDARHSEAA